jgi:hypothetical protein
MSADCKLQLVLTLTPIPNKSTSLVHVLIKINEGFLEEWDINKKNTSLSISMIDPSTILTVIVEICFSEN